MARPINWVCTSPEGTVPCRAIDVEKAAVLLYRGKYKPARAHVIAKKPLSFGDLYFEWRGKLKGACCKSESRNMNGGCDSCGDPCL